MTIEKYIRAVQRKLNLPTEMKERVINDFRSSIEGRKEAGLSDQEIINELGTPKEVAGELNIQMKEFAYKKSPWRWACLAAAAVGITVVGYHGLTNWLADILNKVMIRMTNAGDVGYIGIIGGADGPTSIFVTAPVESSSKQIMVFLLLAVMGIVGFFALRKCPPIKKENTDYESPEK